MGDDPRRWVHIAVRNGKAILTISGDVAVQDMDGITWVKGPMGTNPRLLEQEAERVAKLRARTAPPSLEPL